MVNLSEVTKNLTEYEVEDPNRLEEVRRIINSHSLDWDTKLPDENGKDVEILLLLLYEYSTQIEKVTQGRVSYRYVLDKIANSVGKIRLGELKDGDEHIQYGKSLNDRSAMIVKSKEFDLQVRAKGYGAGHFDYIDDNKEHKSAVAIFGKKTIQDKDGRNVFIKGAEFNDLSDLRQTMFHEWTHEMELEILTEKDFEQRDLPLRKYTSPDGRIFENYDEVTEYTQISINVDGEKVYEVETLPKCKKFITSHGLTTDELIDGKKKKHNQITEGFVEETARTIMRNLEIPESEIDTERYYEQVKMAIEVIAARDGIQGKGKTVADFVSQSIVLKKELEEKEVDGTDGLHYISDYANKARAERAEREMVLSEIMSQYINKLGLSREQVARIQKKLCDFGEVSLEDIEELLGGNPDIFVHVNSIIKKNRIAVQEGKEFSRGIRKKLGYNIENLNKKANFYNMFNLTLNALSGRNPVTIEGVKGVEDFQRARQGDKENEEVSKDE